MAEVSQPNVTPTWLGVAKWWPRLCVLGIAWLTLSQPTAQAGSGADSLVRPNSSLLYAVEASPDMPVGFAWQLQVSSDGMVNLGNHGSVKVAGLTFAEAKMTIDKKIGLTYNREKHASRPKFGESLQRFKQIGERVDEREMKPTTPSSDEIVQVKAPVTRKHEIPAPSTAALAYDSPPNEMKPAPVVKAQTPPTEMEPTPVVKASMPPDEMKPAPVVKAPTPPQASERAPLKSKSSKTKLVRLSKGRTAPASAPEEPAQASFPNNADVVLTAMETNGPASVPAAMRKAGAPIMQLGKGRAVAGASPEALEFLPPAPHECNTISLPPYVIHPPDILLIESTRSLRDQPINGQHLVRPDGTVGLGIYGSAYVAGMTLDQAKAMIASEISQRVKEFDIRDLSVDVLAYNSKVYYVITDGGGFGEQVYRLPVTGYETVLDALAQINGLPPVASKKHIWVARPCAAAPCGQMILPVDWKAIACGGLPETNYQLFPGDRVYVKADKLITIDSKIAKALSPIERLLGVTLLGSTTYNSITGRGFGFGN